jgi:hypothetical protein
VARRRRGGRSSVGRAPLRQSSSVDTARISPRTQTPDLSDEEDRAQQRERSSSTHTGYTVLQYWYFYAFNDWRSTYFGVNDHEADRRVPGPR